MANLELLGFTPTEQYHPSTKKYVDDIVDDMNTDGAFVYIPAQTTTTIASSGTYYKMSGTTTEGGKNGNITTSNNKITYTGTKTKYAMIDISAVVETESASQTIGIKIAKNGVVSDLTDMETFCRNANESFFISLSVFTQLSTNDYIELFLTNKTSTASVKVNKLHFRLNTIFTQ